MLPPCVAEYPYFWVWTVVLGMQRIPYMVLTAPVMVGLLCMNQPILGASPAFLFPPHVGLFTMDAWCLADLPALIKTIAVYIILPIYFIIPKEWINSLL